MSFFVCGCGLSATTKLVIASSRLCVGCGGELVEMPTLPLSFWNKHKCFEELDEDALVGRRKQVLEAIKIIQPCSNRMIKDYLCLEINQVTGRVNELANASIPFIKEVGSKIDEKTNKEVTLWGVC